MKKLLLAILIVSSLSACNDWLDVKPKSQMEQEELFNNYAGFKDALTGCYMSMCDNSVYGQYLTMQIPDIMANLWTVSSFGELSDYQVFVDFNYESQVAEDVFSEIWGGLYHVVVQCNSILNAIDERADVFPSEQARAIVEAEARALRACCHFDVLRLWGQMPQGGSIRVALPYTEDVSREAKIYYDFEEFCEKLEMDLDSAATLLEEYDVVQIDNNWETWGIQTSDDNLFTNRDLRMNYFAVKALQARYYLYVGKKEEAYTAAKVIVNNEYAGELAGTADYTAGYTTLPSEALFHLNKSDWTNTQNESVFGSIENTIEPPVYISQQNLTELYPNTLLHNRYLNVFNTNKMNASSLRCPILVKYYRDVNLVGMNPAGSVLMHQVQVIPILRASEMYLIVMETSNDLSEVNRLYYDYMAARDILVSQTYFSSLADVQTEVVNEYRREFYGEGQMFFTYKRLGATTMMWRNGPVTESNYIVPIPDSEYSAN